jgi:uroporphyrin-III C-methyltransferase
MSSEPTLPPEPPAPLPVVAAQPEAAGPRTATVARTTLAALIAICGVSLLMSAMLWQKLSGIQEQLARQSQESGTAAIEARTMARQAQDMARDSAARQAVLEQRLSEVSLQRSQLEDLMQTLSRTRDENLVVDIESALRLAQQQMQLTGSAEPLLAALRTADQRLAKAAQPRLARVRAAMARDTERLKSTSLTDVPGVLARLDDMVRQADELPAANAVPRPISDNAHRALPPAGERAWWQRTVDAAWDEVRGLVRVSRINQPEAALLSPDQSFFLRENLKLKLLNARLSLLARQTEAARSDIASAAAALYKYFDPASRRTQAMATQLQQVQQQLRGVELPRIDETFAALAAAGAGR